MVFTVDNGLLDTLKKTADDVRSKDVFEFRSFTAQSIDLTFGGQTRSYAKTKPAPAAGQDASAVAEIWKQTKPEAKDVDQTKITDILTTISNLRAEKFAEKPATGGDELVVAAKFGDAGAQKDERITLRKVNGVVQAIRPGEPGAAIVSTADFDRALAAFKELAGIK